MRYLEVRRHARRERRTPHLIQPGVDMARKLGKKLGPFDLVVSSPLPRCVETAVAMGFAVERDYPELAGKDERGESFPGLDDLDWDAGFAGFAQMWARSGEFAEFATAQADLWRQITLSVPDSGRVLLIGHGGFIESAAVAAFPHADHAGWGRTVRHCEGLLVGINGDAFVAADILRVPKNLLR